ncbi:hypothetical protein CBM2623_A80209 [Cupriavidus taiwanensis]|nr:hypothetical protein CBM2608_A70170 [Cupriavidus taiwanensis]SPA31700.1 hypothetical protein CBM2623_A80209 [Cupriavidus taiwanensis]
MEHGEHHACGQCTPAPRAQQQSRNSRRTLAGPAAAMAAAAMLTQPAPAAAVTANGDYAKTRYPIVLVPSACPLLMPLNQPTVSVPMPLIRSSTVSATSLPRCGLPMGSGGRCRGQPAAATGHAAQAGFR